MGTFDELIHKKVVLNSNDLNPQAVLLAKDSTIKVPISRPCLSYLAVFA